MPEEEAEVADPVDDERLDRGGVGAGLAVVEADQQVRGDADALPAEEELQEVVGGHQRQHGEGEERQVGEEARLVALARLEVLVVVHVAEAVEMHERRHGGDDHQHDRRQPVEPDAPVGRQRPRHDPAEQRTVPDLDAVEGEEDDPGQHEREEQEPGGGDERRPLAQPLVAEAAEHRAEQRREQDDRRHRSALHHVDVLDRDRVRCCGRSRRGWRARSPPRRPRRSARRARTPARPGPRDAPRTRSG